MWNFAALLSEAAGRYESEVNAAANSPRTVWSILPSSRKSPLAPLNEIDDLY
jgi:hypothetical protein